MSQSRTHSAFEAVSNVLIGYGVGLVAQLIIFPLFGIKVSFVQNIGIGMAFTLVSLVRSYFLRRWFNRMARRVESCRHEFDYLRDMSDRDAAGNVSCKCCKCGETFTADCGLHLPGRLIQKEGSMQAMYDKDAAIRAANKKGPAA